MRIVQLVENLEAGGLERIALDLAVALNQLGHLTRIYCLHDRGKLADEAEASGVPVTAFGKPPGFSAKALFQIARQLRRDEIDVVHTHNPGVHHYGAIAARFARGAVVLSTRHSAMDSKGRPYNERYFKLVTRWTHAIASVCDRTRVQLIESAGIDRAKSVVVYNGIRLGPYRDRPAATPGAGLPERVRFGTVGRLVPAKGHAVLLDAFAIVRRAMPGAELRIGGYGELEGKLREQAARLGLEGLSMERVTAADAPDFYGSLDVFVLSSVNEGLPLVILEAMAAGLPIVSTRVGGVAEVAPEGEVAGYCEPGSAESLAEAMLAAVRDPAALARQGAVARELAMSRYGVEHMAANYLALIEQRHRSEGNSGRY